MLVFVAAKKGRFRESTMKRRRTRECYYFEDTGGAEWRGAASESALEVAVVAATMVEVVRCGLDRIA